MQPELRLGCMLIALEQGPLGSVRSGWFQQQRLACWHMLLLLLPRSLLLTLQVAPQMVPQWVLVVPLLQVDWLQPLLLVLVMLWAG